MTTLAIARSPRNIKVRFRPRPVPANAKLDRELDDLAGVLEGERFASSSWVAGRVRELAERARFLRAETAEDYDAREQTLNEAVITIRKCPKVAGRYQGYDLVDGNGKVVRACTDLFDAMMWIQQQV